MIAFRSLDKYIGKNSEHSGPMADATPQPIPVAEAQRIVVESILPLRSERVPLHTSYRRVLAADAVAREDIPSFDNSSMDGFAIRAADVGLNFPSTLKLAGEISAGGKMRGDFQGMTAVRVMTGAPIPRGADTVVEQELVVLNNGSIHIQHRVQAGRNIRRKGEDIRAGQTVIQRGTLLKAAHVGVLASMGISSVEVYRLPRVAFFTTGNELISAGARLRGPRIRNSNAYSIKGLLLEMGCVPMDLGVARDDEAAIRKKIVKGLRYDALVTSGGVSVGKYDFVLSVLEKLEVERKFWKVNIKPGGPFAFSVFKKGKRTVPVFSLPGNPVSAIVTFLEFVQPGLQRMMGIARIEQPIRLMAKLEEEIRKKDSKRHFVRGILRNEAGALFVKSTGPQSSGVLTSLTAANCLVVLPEGQMVFNKGDDVEVQLL